MKNIFFSRAQRGEFSILPAVGSVVFTLMLLLFSASNAQAHEKEERSINVNGIGEVEVAVDNVMINVGINTRDKNIAAAKKASQEKYDALLKVLEKNGLNKNSIKSNFSSINPVYVPCYPTQENPRPKCDATKIDYYDMNRNLEIKLEDLTKYDALISALSEGGATNVYTGQYGVTNIAKYRDQARELAIDSAKSKADKVAKKLAVTLGKPIRFDSYDGDANTPPMPMMAQRAMKANMAMEMAGSGAATDTQTMGKMKVVSNVNIAYGIE